MIAAIVFSALASRARLPQFVQHSIATDLRGGYQVIAVDMNRDSKTDLIALGMSMTDLVWFENPSWQRHVIVSNVAAPINAAAWDIDGDKIPEIALAAGFNTNPSRSPGTVSILRHTGDPRRPWDVKEIDRLATSHRLQWADIDGTGKKALVNAPLAPADSASPEYRGATPLTVYREPEWKRETITDKNEGVVHSLTVFDVQGVRRDNLITAGFSGVFAHYLAPNGSWQRVEILKGDPAPYPGSGASEFEVGRLNANRFFATIEPWHGNQVVTYVRRDNQWQRNVIDATLNDGHTLIVADLDGDGRDEIVAGTRRAPQGVFIYNSTDSAGAKWDRRALDEGLSIASCVAADINGDKKQDLACIGGTTLKWYENVQ